MALLSVGELRQFVDFPAGDDGDRALQKLLDAAEADITNRIGVAGATTEIVDGGYASVVVSRPLSSVTSIIEDFEGYQPFTVAPDDYQFTAGGYVIHRLYTGTNPRHEWFGRQVQVTYTVADDEAARERVQIALVKHDVAYRPGLIAESIGAWSQSYAASAYQSEREDILSTLVEQPLMAVL